VRGLAVSGGIWATVGTRPEAIKLAPVVRALRARGAEVTVCSTGQHPALCGEALAAMGLRADLSLPAPTPGGPLPELLAGLVSSLGDALAAGMPRAVVVHGDTTSTLAAALAASLLRLPLAHVEAGLRTHDRAAPFPEETHRRLVDALADRCYAPTMLARDHLRAEGIDPARIEVSGNPIVDALRSIVSRVTPTYDDTPVVLVTAHRRENLDALGRICDAVARLAAEDVRIVWPVHPNPAVEQVVRGRLSGVGRIALTRPLDYVGFVERLLGARLVLTDSGGVQEEAACLGRPTLVLRRVTERPEVLSTGVVALVGTDPDAIVARAKAWLANPPEPAPGPFPLGDGHAGERIADSLLAWLS
jgi:UDP-N-acetylglucosamine 2-epimerase (non-hydrolysing)